MDNLIIFMENLSFNERIFLRDKLRNFAMAMGYGVDTFISKVSPKGVRLSESCFQCFKRDNGTCFGIHATRDELGMVVQIPISDFSLACFICDFKEVESSCR